MLPSYLSVLKILNQSNFKRSRNKGSIEFLLNSLYKQVVSDQCLMKTCKDSVPEHIKDSYRLCVHFAVIIYTLYEKLFETYSMKTPERWRALPRHALLVSILTQKLSNDVKTSCHDVAWSHMVSHVITKYVQSVQSIQVTSLKSSKITFFKMATLTFDLWPVRISNSSAMRVLTDEQTHTQDRFYKKNSNGIKLKELLDRAKGAIWAYHSL